MSYCIFLANFTVFTRVFQQMFICLEKLLRGNVIDLSNLKPACDLWYHWMKFLDQILLTKKVHRKKNNKKIIGPLLHLKSK